jgi:ribonucleoside-diphosphate reductase beta chain|tara:strand:+ start:3848 stop:4921 length:1074 start_codon:yes stop_codon:yes gene_type:complete
MAILKKSNKSHLLKNMFLDEGVDIQRFDLVKYPQLEKITEKQLGFFWRPEEVDISKDKKDFDNLTEHEQHIFTSNLKRQILLDSVQGRAPNMAFLPIASLPEVENWVETWSFFETIHSRSYTHIIRNVYPDPSVVFDNMLDIKEILDCGNDIAKYYDDLIDCNNSATNRMDHKRALWMCMLSANALEGVRFYVSFACSWAFAELKKMEGNAKIIKFIARDENTHLAGTTTILKKMIAEDKDFEKISKEMEPQAIDLFTKVIEQEKEWAHYLFKDGSMIGLNETILKDYIEWIGCKRMRALNLPCPYTVPKLNPLPWTEKWIAGSSVQVAPQETEITSYVTGGVKQDVDEGTLKGLSL